MGLESPFTGKYIDELNVAWPVGADDAKSYGDDHIRGIKQVLQNTFSQISGEVTADEAELNTMEGITATTDELNIMSGVTADASEISLLEGRSLASTDDVIDNFPAATSLLFKQAAVPTGWERDTSDIDGAVLRITTGTGGGTGGSHNLESAPSVTHTHTGTAAGNTGYTVSGLPAHTHSYNYVRGDETNGTVEMRPSDGYVKGHFVGATTGSQGSGSNHRHSFTDAFTTSGASANNIFRPKYMNAVLSKKL